MVCGCRRAGTKARLCRSGVKGEGAGPVLSWPTLQPPPFPTPGQAWFTYVVCGCCWAGTTARTNTLTQIMPNSSSCYARFYSVIYNSVLFTYVHSKHSTYRRRVNHNNKELENNGFISAYITFAFINKFRMTSSLIQSKTMLNSKQ